MAEPGVIFWQRERIQILRGPKGGHIFQLGFAMSGVAKLFRRLLGRSGGRIDSHAPLRVEQRRGRRVRATAQILLYGRLADEPFQEQTETIDVSSHGGLFPVSAAVVPSQKLIVTNLETNDDLACRVARLIRTEHGQTLAAVEFLQPSLRFWGAAVASFGHENSTAERIS
ncbi:MAG: hypothetical protein WB987_13220 [Candidatus Acidiferrales bacterium]